jgi:hypothetical protein
MEKLVPPDILGPIKDRLSADKERKWSLVGA